MPIAQKVEFSLFLIFFLPFGAVSSKAHGWLSYFGVHLFLISRSSCFSFWSSFLFIFFLKWAESHSAGSKVLCYYSLFIPLHSGSLRYRLLALWEVTPGFLLFLLDLWYLRRTYLSSVSCVLLAFPLSCLNPFLTVLHASGIPSLWQPLRIPTQLSFYASNFSIFWYGLLFFFFLLFS